MPVRNFREIGIELIDGDPVSAIGHALGVNSRTGKFIRAFTFAAMTHVAMGTLGAVDIPWGSSSAFGVPHYRFINETSTTKKKEKGEFMTTYYNRMKGD